MGRVGALGGEAAMVTVVRAKAVAVVAVTEVPAAAVRERRAQPLDASSRCVTTLRVRCTLADLARILVRSRRGDARLPILACRKARVGRL
eukprot:700673-Pleurochrysis_carterae.AAC.1